ncbi:DUF1573 domain-containing protein [Roseivirga sp.]|uniref:DUF1573 domain-containing protein n=1 Tax=Roseivirga sp. TaxID=1964215 RepID=UPI002B27C114|nr:DUF1573 domain-containing protein [Roseivirga sp.]
MSKFFRLLFLFCIPTLVLAQKPEVIEVGVIDGEVGTFYFSFPWENTSEDTVTISFWSGEEKLKLDKETIKVEPKQTVAVPFNIATGGYVGGFRIGLRVLTSTEIILKEYIVEGRILAPVIDVFKAYRNVFWPFRSKYQVVNFKSGFMGDELNAEMILYNFGGASLDLKGANISAYYDVKFQPTEIPHNSFTKMSIVLKTDSLLSPGFAKEIVQVKDKNDSLVFSIPVQFTLEQKPSQVNADSPYLAISDLDYDFKIMSPNTKKSVTITLSNRGNELLDLYKIESNCSCLQYNINKAAIASGESIEMEVTFDATDRLGYERKTLAIFSNDPRKPTAVITFRSHVK